MKSLTKAVLSGQLSLWTECLYSDHVHNHCILIAGAGASAMFWSNHLCQNLVDAGYAVIRFDHRKWGQVWTDGWV